MNLVQKMNLIYDGAKINRALMDEIGKWQKPNFEFIGCKKYRIFFKEDYLDWRQGDTAVGVRRSFGTGYIIDGVEVEASLVEERFLNDLDKYLIQGGDDLGSDRCDIMSSVGLSVVSPSRFVVIKSTQ